MNTISMEDRSSQKTIAAYLKLGSKHKRTQYFCGKCGRIVSPKDMACNRCGVMFIA